VRREHVNSNKKTSIFYDTKSGNNRTVALSETAFFILITLPKSFNRKIFPFKKRDEAN